jgi:hypothetical protein
MGKVVLELSISLDGFVTGPDVGSDAPLGIGGERPHEWMFAGKSATEVETFATAYYGEIGALVMGRRMVDLGTALTLHAEASRTPTIASSTSILSKARGSTGA